MKRQISMLLSFCAFLLFISCDKKETFDDLWKIDNEAQFAKITTNSEYTRINAPSTNGYIMYKELKSGDGETPFFTDKVKVLYTGWFKRQWSLGDTYLNNKGETVYNKYIFDSTENRNNIPSSFHINPMDSSTGGLIEGFYTALQYMQVGDKWEIWIPWELGYGSVKKGSIEPYTTLVFEIELVGIIK